MRDRLGDTLKMGHFLIVVAAQLLVVGGIVWRASWWAGTMTNTVSILQAVDTTAASDLRVMHAEISRIDNEGSRNWNYSRSTQERVVQELKAQITDLQASLRTTQDTMLRLVILSEQNQKLLTTGTK